MEAPSASRSRASSPTSCRRRRRRSDPVDPELERPRCGRQRVGSVRHGAATRVRRRRAHRCGHARGVADRHLATGPCRSGGRGALRGAAPLARKARAAGGRDPHGSRLDQPSHPVLASGAVVLTSTSGAAQLDGALPPASTLVALGDAPALDLRRALAVLRERGHSLVLSEAGPHTFGGLVKAGLADELFLTVSPQLAGNRGPEAGSGSRSPSSSFRPVRPTGCSACAGMATTSSCATGSTRERSDERRRPRGARHAPRALLRPRLRLRVHAGHRAHHGRSQLAGLVKGLLVLGVLWWAWAASPGSRTPSTPRTASSASSVFGAMAAMLVAWLAVPDVFGNDAFVFACAYAAVRIAHLGLYAVAGRGDRDLLVAISRLTAGSGTAIILLFVASALDGPAQTAVWAVTSGATSSAPGSAAGAAGGSRQATSPNGTGSSWVIAIGESIVAIGVGATNELRPRCGHGRRSRARRRRRALGGRTSTSSSIVAERRLREATGKAQLTMARDSYSYLHLPMVAGIILFAVGVKKTLVDLGEPLATVPAVALCGGVALYLGAHILFRLRNVRSLEPAAARRRRPAARPDSARARASGTRDARGRRRALRRTDRFRGDPLCGGARRDPASSRGVCLGLERHPP